MAKKKNKKLNISLQTKEPIETRYYWCVNCGHHGDYGKVRKRGLVCEECSYDDVTPYTEKEINSDCCHKNLSDFKRKSEEKPPAFHKEIMDAVKEAKTLLKENTQTESKFKNRKETIADKIAQIRRLK